MTADAGRRPDPIRDDHHWMQRALQLAERGWGRVHPNPMVGAVVVRDGVVVGEGWHAEFGDAHAETIALEAAGSRAAGATLYVTLEPCNHHGKQPPCVDRILAVGLSRVVIAMSDPNPEAGGGMARLRAAGLVVETGLCAVEARALNAAFCHLHSSSDRPFVAVKLAVSMDGCIADARGGSRWLSGEGARAWVHELRAGFDAIGVGAHTAVFDSARLTARGTVPPRTLPRRIVFDRKGTFPADHPMLHDGVPAPVVVAVAPTVSAEQRAALIHVGARVLIAETLADVLVALRADGVTSLLIEGGGRLAGAMMAGGLIDRIYQIQCPIWLGDGFPAWHGLGTPALGTAARWQQIHSEVLSGDGDTLMVLER